MPNSCSEHIHYIALTIIVSSVFKPKKEKKKTTDIECLVDCPGHTGPDVLYPMSSDSEAYILLSEIGVRRVLQVSGVYPCSEASYMVSPSEVYSSALSPP